MTDGSESNRRKYPRVATETMVSVARVGSSDLLGWSLDVSPGGIRFQWVGLEVEVGELLRITLDLGGHQASALGKVVRVAQLDAIAREVALAFVEADARTLELIENHLEGDGTGECAEAGPFDPASQGEGDGPTVQPEGAPKATAGRAQRLLRRLPLVGQVVSRRKRAAR
jgi:hypothetical protein